MSCHRSGPVYRKGSGLGSLQPALLVPAPEQSIQGDPLVASLGELCERAVGDVLRRDFPLAGGYSYDPVALFSVWMLALLKRIPSTRALEESCRYDDRFRHLCRGCQPDHSTLSRFRQSLGDRLDELMLLVATEASSQGLLSLRRVAADGTKLAGACSQWQAKAQAMDSELEEARMRTAQGSFVMGYNVQAAVDMDSGMVAAIAVTNYTNDLRGLEPLMEAWETQAPALPETLVADRGFDSFPNVHALESRGVVAYLPSMREGTSPFSPDEQGIFRCLAGHIPKESLWISKEGKAYRNMRVSHCRNCPLADECGHRKGHQSRMKVPVGEPFGNRQSCHLRCQTLKGKELLRIRRLTVELMFARLKQELGLRRFKLKGKAGARLEFGMASLALNLKILLRFLEQLFACLRGQNGPSFVVELLYFAK